MFGIKSKFDYIEKKVIGVNSRVDKRASEIDLLRKEVKVLKEKIESLYSILDIKNHPLVFQKEYSNVLEMLFNYLGIRIEKIEEHKKIEKDNKKKEIK